MNIMQAMYVVCIRLAVGEEERSCSGDNTSSADFLFHSENQLFIERADANYLCFTSPEFSLTLSLLGFAHTFTRADTVCVMVPDGFRD